MISKPVFHKLVQSQLSDIESPLLQLMDKLASFFSPSILLSCLFSSLFFVVEQNISLLSKLDLSAVRVCIRELNIGTGLRTALFTPIMSM